MNLRFKKLYYLLSSSLECLRFGLLGTAMPPLGFSRGLSMGCDKWSDKYWSFNNCSWFVFLSKQFYFFFGGINVSIVRDESLIQIIRDCHSFEKGLWVRVKPTLLSFGGEGEREEQDYITNPLTFIYFLCQKKFEGAKSL